MELRHPLLFLILSILVILFLIFYRKKSIKYDKGSKIANTSFIKNTDYFKKKLKKFKTFKLLITCLCIISIFTTLFLMARLSVIETSKKTEYNRDIMLCMDVSGSVLELNLDMVKTLKNTVENLQGDRFGITIFNSSAVTILPLTDDYDYVLNELDKMEKAIEAYESDISDISSADISYIFGGVNEGGRGTSLIGEGLATCVYGFSNLEEERSRAIIFTTDNFLSGTPIITTEQAAGIAKDKNIKIFSIGTENTWGENETVLKESSIKTGGKYYKQNGTTVKKMVNDIDKMSKSSLESQLETTQTDIPTIPFIILVSSLIILIVINRMVIK